MKSLTPERINSLSLNDAKGYKAEAAAEAKKINAKINDPDFAATSERREELSSQLDEALTTAEACGTRIEAIEAQRSAAVARANGRDITGMPGGRDFGRYADHGGVMTFAQALSTPGDDAGFAGFGDYLKTIRRQKTGTAYDQRLSIMAAQSGGDHPSGGFLVPDLLRNEIIATVDDDEPWLRLVDRFLIPNGYGSASWPVLADRDESGGDKAGVSLTRRNENTAIAESTMVLERWKLEPTSVATLIKVSNELLEDALPGSVDSAIRALFARNMQSRQAIDIINGTGAGSPVGIVESSGTFTAAKEGGQAADTIVGANLLEMRSRMKPSSLNRAVWLAHPSAYTQLLNAHTTLTNDDFPQFMHGNGSDVPDTLLGRPIFFTSACKSVGDKGDILLANLSQYQYGQKPLVVDMSTQVQFENHQAVYKFVLRDAGRPKHNSIHTDIRGFQTSEFVTLAERA